MSLEGAEEKAAREVEYALGFGAGQVLVPVYTVQCEEREAIELLQWTAVDLTKCLDALKTQLTEWRANTS